MKELTIKQIRERTGLPGRVVIMRGKKYWVRFLHRKDFNATPPNVGPTQASIKLVPIIAEYERREHGRDRRSAYNALEPPGYLHELIMDQSSEHCVVIMR